jgi:4'-phosphopantetheinyl transferase
MAFPAAETHIWRISLDIAPAALACRWQVLSEDERQRADRFRFDRDRRRFIAAHSALRHILSGYVGAPPHTLRFDVNGYGKPTLAWPAGRLEFNLSHAGKWAVTVVAAHAVGVDIERIREDFATYEIAERFFAPEEVRELLALPADERVKAFFLCWTRKEAYIKARGQGLSIPLDSFAVSLDPDRPRLLRDDLDAQSSRWHFANLVAPEGYLATVVVEGASGTRIEREWRVE